MNASEIRTKRLECPLGATCLSYRFFKVLRLKNVRRVNLRKVGGKFGNDFFWESGWHALRLVSKTSHTILATFVRHAHVRQRGIDEREISDARLMPDDTTYVRGTRQFGE